MTIEKPTVAVLMSTYNGEHFIREQIDSIFKQSDVDVKLYVRDDGSVDSTKTILVEYAQTYPLTVLDDSERVGPGESFLRLMYACVSDAKAEYYAFSDQDDIWFEDKLISAVHKINESRTEEAVLYTSNQMLFAEGESRGVRHKEKQPVDLISHMTCNTIAGCTFVMNKRLAELIADSETPDPTVLKYRLHDAWIFLVGIVNGFVLYDEDPHMYYRLHESNVVGIKKISFLARVGRIKRFLVKSEDVNLRFKTAKELLRLYPNMHEQDKRILELYANYRNSWDDKKKLAFSKEIRANCGERPGVFTIKTLLGVV